MIITKKFLLIIFFTLTSCGYQSIYAKKEVNNFFIKEINTVGSKEVNRMIVEQLPIDKSNPKKIPYSIKLATKKLNKVIAKDRLGNPSIYNITIEVEVTVNSNGTTIKERDFNKNFSYNAMENKFDQLKYVKNIEQNLINKIAEEILIFLYY